MHTGSIAMSSNLKNVAQSLKNNQGVLINKCKEPVGKKVEL